MDVMAGVLATTLDHEDEGHILEMGWRREFKGAAQGCSPLNCFYMGEKYTSILFKKLFGGVSMTGSCTRSLLIQVTYSQPYSSEMAESGYTWVV